VILNLGSALANQVPHDIPPVHFALGYLEMESWGLFAWGSLAPACKVVLLINCKYVLLQNKKVGYRHI
jgi:hypothetical protein